MDLLVEIQEYGINIHIIQEVRVLQKLVQMDIQEMDQLVLRKQQHLLLKRQHIVVQVDIHKMEQNVQNKTQLQQL